MNELMARIVFREERQRKMLEKGVAPVVIQIEEAVTNDMKRLYHARTLWLFRCVGLV